MTKRRKRHSSNKFDTSEETGLESKRRRVDDDVDEGRDLKRKRMSEDINGDYVYDNSREAKRRRQDDLEDEVGVMYVVSVSEADVHKVIGVFLTADMANKAAYNYKISERRGIDSIKQSQNGLLTIEYQLTSTAVQSVIRVVHVPFIDALPHGFLDPPF